MKIVYNNLTLAPVHFHEFSQRSIYSEDGADYLFTHFVIDVTCVFNPAATCSWNDQPQNPPGANLGPNGAVANGNVGDLPAQSLDVLRNSLLQPRQSLIVDVGGYPLLSSPPILQPPGFSPAVAPCDINNGPRPISCNVTAFQGTTTAIVRFKIETWVNEFTTIRYALLSNRWEMTETIGEDYRSNFHYEGIAIWSADLMQLLGLSPDLYRNTMLIPPRLGFQRKNLLAKLSSDGTRFRYSFDDDQQIVALYPTSGIVRAEGYTEAHIDWSGGKYGMPGLRLPELTAIVYAEAWGRPSATRATIAQALVRILAASGVNVTKRVGIKVRLSVDLTRRHGSAEVHAVSSGIIGSLANLFIAPNLQDLAQGFFEVNVPGIWTMTNAAGTACISPGGDGLRGDANPKLLLVAQQLLGFNGPAGPPLSA